jgi:hypothetical protein
MAKEDRIGALWRPKTDNDKAPLAKGNIEFMGRTIKVVVWPNRWKKEGERTPDFYVELDTYEPGQPKRETADDPIKLMFQTPEAPKQKPEAAPPSLDGFTDEIPW